MSGKKREKKKQLGWSDHLLVKTYLYELYNRKARPSVKEAQRLVEEEFGDSLYKVQGLSVSKSIANNAFAKFGKPGKNVAPNPRSLTDVVKQLMNASKARKDDIGKGIHREPSEYVFSPAVQQAMNASKARRSDIEKGIHRDPSEYDFPGSVIQQAMNAAKARRSANKIIASDSIGNSVVVQNLAYTLAPVDLPNFDRSPNSKIVSIDAIGNSVVLQNLAYTLAPVDLPNFDQNYV